MSLLYISQQITIYLGLFLLITGVVGNGLLILTFSAVRTYRKTPCTFYFLIRSADNIAFILINLISRIVSAGYGIDLTRTSVVWCKIRQYFVLTLGFISFTCSCLASIDQFLATSRNANLRRLSNIKWTYRIIVTVLIVCCLHGIPAIIFDDILPNIQMCGITNGNYSIYITVYVLTFSCIGPIIIMVVFGYLTYHNIHSTRFLAEQQADRQLAQMVLMEVVLVVISISPYSINTLYNLITSGIVKDTNRLLIESFIFTITSQLYYFYYVESCYMFLISSNRFRRTTKDRLLFWRKRSQINPSMRFTTKGQTLERI
ncbi:unnamed protein product [Adineta steineri]|uniref:G-protein coupled receptors family 1 profile domain-containing protein n=1 Tax=Adineta steineri TaxID=433720 RepID=A0A819J400_9BILA|nr:unnamed protein product [Adineta steineri]